MELHHSSSGGGTSDPNRGGGEPSCVSMKSNWSMPEPPVFSRGGGEPSCVSMKSDRSMPDPPVFSGGGGEPSCVKSDGSFSSGDVPSGPEKHSLVEGTGDLQPDSYTPVDHELLRVSEKLKTSMKNKYESLFEGIRTEENKILLNRIYTQLYIIDGESGEVNQEHEVLQMERTSWKHQQDTPITCSEIFKPLPDNNEEMYKKKRPMKVKQERKDKKTKTQKIRSVLTKGIAGIGKTVSVQKFLLDWTEGEASQDVDFMFVLLFRELNLIKDDQFSLYGLLCDFHPEIKDLDPNIYDDLKTVFIFDGLDESRIPLNFEECEKVSDVTMTSSVGALMTNLIRGDLLPSARIWITSRPAEANQIPPQHIDRVTEIQGFSDPQKDEYFRKRIRDEDQAQRIISHIKKARNLHIMCHIPVFCWISATVLQRIIREPQTEIPQTLTEMYSHFLLTQITKKNQKKYEENEERDPKNLLESNRTMFLQLAELAFKQLINGNVMFYEEDLRESGIDVTEASVYSGVFTEIFREEHVLHQRKIYCFVHLSFQEFLAAVYLFHCYENKKMEGLPLFLQGRRERERRHSECETYEDRKGSDRVSLDNLLERAVDEAVKSQHGYLDLFFRFLLGISLESNQKLLQGLLTQTHSSSERITKYIKESIKRDEYYISTERSLNLFLCLSEMKDQSLSRELQEFLKSEKHSEEFLSPGQCSALAYMLLTSGEVLDELDLKKYRTSKEGVRRLIPAVSVCRKALLAYCNLRSESCEDLRSALQSVNCSLKELDLRNNDLQDSGVELLSAGLKSSHCKLEILRLAGCNLRPDSCKALRSALQSERSSLKELDLSNNDLQDSGVEQLSDGLKSSHCKLEILRLSGCMVTEEGCAALASALNSNPSHLRELDLTYNHPGESGVELLSGFLEDPQYRLDKLQVEFGGEVRMNPGLKKYACNLTLDPNTAHKRLSLSEGNRKVKCVKIDQRYPDHPDRFDHYVQVLSAESLSGRCYWEAEWSGHCFVCVSYRGIKRKGASKECRFGYNNLSWRLNDFSLRQSTESEAVMIAYMSRVGVYLDWTAGTLSCYHVSPDTHTLTHLHTLHTTFTEPLYAGFELWSPRTVQLCLIGLCVCGERETPVESSAVMLQQM